MAVGFPTSKNDIDGRAGRIALDIRDGLAAAAGLKAWLDTQPDANLTALGYTTGEVAILKSAMADLNQLNSIYTGAANLATAKDFRTFAKLLLGVN